MLGGGGGGIYTCRGAYKTFEYNDNLLAAIRMVFIRKLIITHQNSYRVFVCTCGCVCVCVCGGGGGYNTI